MSFKIAIASGKGGTGKTTVSINLFHYLKNSLEKQIHLVDCDVEEPNDILFFPDAKKVNEINVYQSIPVINTDKCTFCRECVSWCEFNAIVVIPPAKFAEVNPSLCHSCGACLVACKENAILEQQQSIGKIASYESDGGVKLTEGKLKIGSAMQTMVIKALKNHIPTDADLILYDAPPGTSCPVVETMSDADYIILVTEPTPFGLYDLSLMVELLKEIKKPFGVIVNKSGLGNDEIYIYLKEKNIELLGEIPFCEEYASNYATGNLFNNIPEKITLSYRIIMENLKQKLPFSEKALSLQE